MKEAKKLRRLTTVAFWLTAPVLILSSCSSEQEQATQERLFSVKATVVERTNEQVARRYTGSLEGEKQAVLYARLTEPVQEVKVREGQHVTPNDILLTLDRLGPTSNYMQTESVYRNAEKNYNKMKYLFDEGAVAESRYDDAKTAYEVAKAQYEAVTQMVEIRSPISGTVTSINVSPGDFVRLGQKLVTVASTGRLRVKFNANPEEVSRFKVGDSVLVSHDAVTDKMVGRIVTIASSADPMTRGFQVEALIDQVRPGFKPGMFVGIEYVLQRLDSVVAVPREAVLNLDGKQTLYVVRDGIALKREVQLGADLVGRVVVSNGLESGDTLVTLGQDYLQDSARVNLTALNGSAQ